MSSEKLRTYDFCDATFITDGKGYWKYDGEKIEVVTSYIPTLTIGRRPHAKSAHAAGLNKVRIEGSDGKTYIGKILSWTKRSIKIRLDDGTVMRFKTD